MFSLNGCVVQEPHEEAQQVSTEMCDLLVTERCCFASIPGPLCLLVLFFVEKSFVKYSVRLKQVQYCRIPLLSDGF